MTATPATRSATLTDAARLVALALRPKVKPARDETYTDLVRRYRSDDAFSEAVRCIALGLDLVILDVNEQHGMVVASADDSVFAIRMSDYSKRTGGEGKAHERVLHALAHLGIAALAYPRPADLSNPAYVGRITVLGVDAFVREAIDRLSKAAEGRGEPVDASLDAPNLEAAWGVYARRAATPGSGDGRRVSSSTTGMASKAMTFLVEQGMLTKSSDHDGGTFTTTSRYRVQVLEAGRRMFGELLDLGITEVTDGHGSLVQIDWSSTDVAQL